MTVVAPIAVRIVRIADGVEESRTRILHEMPAVGDPNRFGQRLRSRFTVTAAAVARDGFDLRMVGEPGLDGGNLTIRQQCHDPPPLQITDDRAVTMAATEGPIINADNFERICLQTGPSPHHPQQRVIIDRDHQPLRKTGRRPAAERQPKMMNDTLQSRGPAGSLGDMPSSCRRWRRVKTL
ncbi:hypothetical protein X739_33350 [Mesorhizobium sp. LNHC220B00]|nr:hypothetical protein X739_33350 [Mesorhizobium sp. LNHC220B00]